VRLRIGRVKEDPSLPDAFRRHLSAIDGITRVDVNPITGSLLILFDQERLQNLESLAAISGVMNEVLPECDIGALDLDAWLSGANGAHGADKPGAPGFSWPPWLASWTVPDIDRADPSRWIPWILAALGVRELLAGRVSAMPSWYDFFWFAFASYHIVNRPHADPPESG
jgi:hypothetical protein